MSIIKNVKSIKRSIKRNPQAWAYLMDGSLVGDYLHGLQYNRFYYNGLPPEIQKYADTSKCPVYFSAENEIRKDEEKVFLNYANSYVIDGRVLYYVNHKGQAEKISTRIKDDFKQACENLPVKGAAHIANSEFIITTINPNTLHLRFNQMKKLARNSDVSPSYLMGRIDPKTQEDNRFILRTLSTEEEDGVNNPFRAIQKIRKDPKFTQFFTKIYSAPKTLSKDKQLVMLEFCSGGDLHSAVKEQPQYQNPRERLQLAYKTLRYLLELVNFLESYNIGIADLKTSNLLLDKTGNIKIGDLKSLIDADALNKNVKDTVFLAKEFGAMSPPYLPEHLVSAVHGGTAIDADLATRPVNFSSLYARQIACIIYEVATGEDVGFKVPVGEKFPALDRVKAMDPQFGAIIEKLIHTPENTQTEQYLTKLKNNQTDEQKVRKLIVQTKQYGKHLEAALNKAKNVEEKKLILAKKNALNVLKASLEPLKATDAAEILANFSKSLQLQKIELSKKRPAPSYTRRIFTFFLPSEGKKVTRNLEKTLESNLVVASHPIKQKMRAYFFDLAFAFQALVDVLF